MRDKSYEGLKDATSFGLICDKNAEIRGSEYWKSCQFSILADLAIFAFLASLVCKLAESDVTSSRNLPISLEIVTFGQDFRDFYFPAVPGLCFASNLFPLITQRLLNQMLRYFIYE